MHRRTVRRYNRTDRGHQEELQKKSQIKDWPPRFYNCFSSRAWHTEASSLGREQPVLTVGPLRFKMGIIPAPHYCPMRGINVVPILQMRKLRL